MKIPINTADEGTAHCLKADYYKMGLTNFMRKEFGGKSDGFIATAIMEIDDDTGDDDGLCGERSPLVGEGD